MKISVGKHKKLQKSATYPELIVFVLGIFLMCIILILPFSQGEDGAFADEAVLVMSNVDKEEIILPDDRTASTEKKWSLYDYIGELVAGLIFGEG